jgi:succinate dehydrogenase / fumarate reductase iron-sulfur subunit
MRGFKEGQTITVEPFRSKAFPTLKDLIINRSALDQIIQAGGFISVSTGSAPDANALLIGKNIAERAMDAAACIGCGAYVAACKNSSVILFVAAKASRLNLLPQGKPEKNRRTLAMIETADAEGFGACGNIYACEAACPKGISVDFISQLNQNCALSAIRLKILGTP